MTKQEFDWKTAHPWLHAAYQFGQANQGWYPVDLGSEEHKAWAKYFQDLGWSPLMFRAFEKKQLSKWTAPCQWPEWLTIDGQMFIAPPKSRPRLAMVD